jgi:hypothetical protein
MTTHAFTITYPQILLRRLILECMKWESRFFKSSLWVRASVTLIDSAPRSAAYIGGLSVVVAIYIRVASKLGWVEF